jgi:hypothetical protein
VASHVEFVGPWRRRGAVTIDATQDIDTVVEELLMAATTVALNPPRRTD